MSLNALHKWITEGQSLYKLKYLIDKGEIRVEDFSGRMRTYLELVKAGKISPHLYNAIHAEYEAVIKSFEGFEPNTYTVEQIKKHIENAQYGIEVVASYLEERIKSAIEKGKVSTEEVWKGVLRQAEVTSNPLMKALIQRSVEQFDGVLMEYAKGLGKLDFSSIDILALRRALNKNKEGVLMKGKEIDHVIKALEVNVEQGATVKEVIWRQEDLLRELDRAVGEITQAQMKDKDYVRKKIKALMEVADKVTSVLVPLYLVSFYGAVEYPEEASRFIGSVDVKKGAKYQFRESSERSFAHFRKKVLAGEYLADEVIPLLHLYKSLQ